MHSVGALQSASSKNRVGEQATCNVWQLQLSRLSVCVCVCVMGVCVCFIGVHCVIIVVIVVSSEPSRDASWSTCYCLPRLPATHFRACHMQHTHSPLQRRCVACGMCYKWMTLAALVSSGRHLGQDEYEAECSVSRCLSRLRVLRVFSVPRSVVAWKWNSATRHGLQQRQTGSGSGSGTGRGRSRKANGRCRCRGRGRGHDPSAECTQTHTHTHTRAHGILTQLLVAAGNAVTHTDTCTHTHTFTHNALDYGAYA